MSRRDSSPKLLDEHSFPGRLQGCFPRLSFIAEMLEEMLAGQTLEPAKDGCNTTVG
jgi:hypothetical protein